MSGFHTRRRNLRTRCEQSDSDDDDEKSQADMARNKEKHSKACLSFADEICSDKMPRKKQVAKSRKAKSNVSSKPTDETEKSHEFTLKVKPLESQPSKPIQSQKTKPSFSSHDEESFDEANIPDAQAIYQARMRRQQMREALDRGEIPLREKPDEVYISSIYNKDDMSGDSDSEQKFMPLKTSLHIAAEERQLVRDRFLTCEQGSDSESSVSSLNDQENFSAWELEQIRKGVGIRRQALAGQGDEVTEQMVAAAQTILASKNVADRSSDESMPKFRKTISVAQIRENLNMRIQGLEAAVRQYHEERKALEDACGNDGAKQLECKENLERCHEFFSALKEYALDIRECMVEKLPQVEDAERKAVELQKAYIQLVVKRRITEVRDQDFEFAPAKTIVTSSFDGDPRAPLDPDRQQKAMAREARRKLRKRRTAPDCRYEDSDGFSSDEDDLGEEVNFAYEQGILHNRFACIWYDVNENFFQLPNVLYVLGLLSQKSPQGHSLVLRYMSSILAPITRCSCFFWNPLKSSLEDESWFKQLCDYCSESDKYSSILQDVTQRVVVPVIVRYARIYDPGSTKQTLNLSASARSALSRCSHSCRESQQFKDFIDSIQTAIAETLEKEVFIPLYPKAVIERQDCSASRFFRRQVSFQIKMFGNVLLWCGILPNDFLICNAVDKILNRCMLFSLRCLGHCDFCARKCLQIAKRVPKEIFSDLSGEKTITQMELFCNFVKQIAQWGIVEKKDSAYDSLKDVLVHLNALDHAVELGFS